MNHFQKMAKIARKRLFTSLSDFEILALMNKLNVRNMALLFMAYLFSTLY